MSKFLRLVGVAVFALSPLVASYSAEPLAEAVRLAQSRGMDFQRSVTVKFEWKFESKSSASSSEETVRRALQAQGFNWSRSESRDSEHSTPKITIIATKSGMLSPETLSTTVASVDKLVAGSRATASTSSWSIVQQQ